MEALSIRRPSLEKFGKALEAARRRQVPRLSQQALAERIGSFQARISSWELGKSEPEVWSVFALEDALGLAPGDLSRFLGYLPVAEEGSKESAAIEDLLLSSITRLSEEEQVALLTVARGLSDRNVST